jgi:hypothetical protein
VVAVAGLAGVADVVEEDAGLAAVVDVVEAVGGFAAVVVVAAAFGAGLAHAKRTDVDEMLRCDIRYADGAALDDNDAERRAVKLLRADVVAMLTDQLVRASRRTKWHISPPTRSHDSRHSDPALRSSNQGCVVGTDTACGRITLLKVTARATLPRTAAPLYSSPIE